MAIDFDFAVVSNDDLTIAEATGYADPDVVKRMAKEIKYQRMTDDSHQMPAVVALLAKTPEIHELVFEPEEREALIAFRSLLNQIFDD